jgi:hypothetical protein
LARIFLASRLLRNGFFLLDFKLALFDLTGAADLDSSCDFASSAAELDAWEDDDQLRPIVKDERPPVSARLGEKKNS